MAETNRGKVRHLSLWNMLNLNRLFSDRIKLDEHKKDIR